MKLLVTGKAGQVAMSLAALRRRGVEIVCVGRPVLDLARPDTIGDIIRAHAPDVVVNAAAYTAVDKAESEAGAAMLVNADGAHAVAMACATAEIPVVHISTDYVFDGTKLAPYTEDDPTGPTGVYGRTKLRGEELVRAACPRHVILRTAWVHSPYGHNFLKTMLRLAATRPEISVVDDQRGNPTYAPHLASAILDVAVKALADGGPWGTYHAAGTGETTWCGLAREVFRVSAAAGGPSSDVKPISTDQYPTPARRPANSRLDCTGLARDFGVALPHWTSGVADCIAALGPTSSASTV